MRRAEISEMQWSYHVEESCWILGRWRGTVGWGWCSYMQLLGMDGVGGGHVAVSSPCFSMRNVYCMMALRGGSWLLAPVMMEISLFAFHSSLLTVTLRGRKETRGGGETHKRSDLRPGLRLDQIVGKPPFNCWLFTLTGPLTFGRRKSDMKENESRTQSEHRAALKESLQISS